MFPPIGTYTNLRRDSYNYFLSLLISVPTLNLPKNNAEGRVNMFGRPDRDSYRGCIISNSSKLEPKALIYEMLWG